MALTRKYAQLSAWLKKLGYSKDEAKHNAEDEEDKKEEEKKDEES